MKYNCIIVDDEPHAITVLENHIKSMDQLQIVGTCKNAFEAINVLNSQKVDLIFLDIHMPKFLGTQLIKTLPHPHQVIFTTAHKDFAVEAFELDAVDYLLKPISFERFVKAVNKFCKIKIVDIAIVESDKSFLYFRAERKMVKVLLDDILYIDSYKDYIVIHERSNALKVKLTMSAVEKMLPQHLFLRIHRSYLVALNKVTAYTKYDVEIGKVELPIGRSFSSVIKKLTDNNAIVLDDDD